MIIGRERERADLEHSIASGKSEFVAVYGRRRIGKTFLIRETCRYQFAFEHTGLKNTLSDENGHDVAVKDATKGNCPNSPYRCGGTEGSRSQFQRIGLLPFIFLRIC